MAKDYEDYRRRNERTQEAVRRRRNADYATRRSAGYYEDEDYSEPVRRARQTGSTKRSGTNAKRRQRDRATQPAAEVIAHGPAVSSAAAVITHAPAM